MATKVPPSNCNIKILIFVDTSLARAGSINGIYMVDNRAPKSQNEGTANLKTYCNTNDYVCWQVKPIDPDTEDTVCITGFDQSYAWGYDGKPQEADKPSDGTVWVGRAENTGTYQTPINLLITERGKNPINVRITPSLDIHVNG